MQLTPKTKLTEVTGKYPFLIDFLAEFNPKYAGLTNPLLRNTLAKTASIGRISTMGGIPADELLCAIRDQVAAQTGDVVEVSIGDMPLTREGRRDMLAAIIRDLHDGADRESVKQRFNDLIEDVGAAEIGEMEQQLIDAGMPETELTKLCDVHLDIFRDTLQDAPPVEVPAGHPVHTFMAENTAITKRITELRVLLDDLERGRRQAAEVETRIGGLLAEIATVDTHYIRKENQLFPYLEKYGVSGPPQVMWTTHDEIRKQLKAVRKGHLEGGGADFIASAREVLAAIEGMVEKEDLILWPMALEKLTDGDWIEMREGEDHIGYCLVEPAADWPPPGTPRSAPASTAEEAAMSTGSDGFANVMLNLQTGVISPEQANLLFNHLPVEVSFTDENHIVRYFSEGKERIFPRSPGVIGRHVEKCHPPKSVHMVKQILAAFENGERDVAEFWLELEGRFIYIRYFAVRDAQDSFRGTMEVVQDVTAIRKLEGSRTLLSWE